MVISVTLRIYPSIVTVEVASECVFDRESVVVRLRESSCPTAEPMEDVVLHQHPNSDDLVRKKKAHQPSLDHLVSSIKNVYVQPPNRVDSASQSSRNIYGVHYDPIHFWHSRSP